MNDTGKILLTHLSIWSRLKLSILNRQRRKIYAGDEACCH